MFSATPAPSRHQRRIATGNRPSVFPQTVRPSRGPQQRPNHPLSPIAFPPAAPPSSTARPSSAATPEVLTPAPTVDPRTPARHHHRLPLRTPGPRQLSRDTGDGSRALHRPRAPVPATTGGRRGRRGQVREEGRLLHKSKWSEIRVWNSCPGRALELIQRQQQEDAAGLDPTQEEVPCPVLASRVTPEGWVILTTPDQIAVWKTLSDGPGEPDCHVIGLLSGAAAENASSILSAPQRVVPVSHRVCSIPPHHHLLLLFLILWMRH